MPPCLTAAPLCPQGARLTAYELVHDGLPATLICDSAAAALMAAGRVDAVVVGADRIAANGDTGAQRGRRGGQGLLLGRRLWQPARHARPARHQLASPCPRSPSTYLATPPRIRAANKIGTYCHAVAAHHHNVPFFVAAPTTTLDPALDDGSGIPIEERSPEEVTHFKGQRVAAEVDVWNPSFDVTPAALIEGIITDRGLVPRAPSAGAATPGFAVRPWLAATGGSDGGSGQNGATEQARSLATQPGFVALDTATVRDYVAARPALAQHVGAPDTKAAWQGACGGGGSQLCCTRAACQSTGGRSLVRPIDIVMIRQPTMCQPRPPAVREVGDGNINFVYILEGPLGALCLKQALPYVRVVGESWPLTQARRRGASGAPAASAPAACLPAVGLPWPTHAHCSLLSLFFPHNCRTGYA